VDAVLDLQTVNGAVGARGARFGLGAERQRQGGFPALALPSDASMN
jgi:hypothetical protein